MGINISALKSKLNQFTRQNDRSDALWKPTEGKTVIRIVPWKDNKENPFVELYFHYSMLCIKQRLCTDNSRICKFI